MLLPLLIIVAVLMDYVLGEPKKFHPLVGFGNMANCYESHVNWGSKPDWLRLFMGLLGLVALILPVVMLFIFLSTYIFYNWFIDIVVLYWAIGHKSLREHIQFTLEALKSNDLEWVLIYRLVNTLDAMWGYRTERFEYFGKAAARFDDVLNWIPARLVALSYALLGNTRKAFNCWWSQANLLNSPNAGPVMTAGAGSLNVQLGGPTYYHGERVDKPYFGSDHEPELNTISECLSLIYKTLILWCAVIALLSFLLSA